jgi:hypothetical protein
MVSEFFALELPKQRQHTLRRLRAWPRGLPEAFNRGRLFCFFFGEAKKKKPEEQNTPRTTEQQERDCFASPSGFRVKAGMTEPRKDCSSHNIALYIADYLR